VTAQRVVPSQATSEGYNYRFFPILCTFSYLYDAQDIKYITAAGGVSFQDKVFTGNSEPINNGLILITGSNETVDITANPQVSAGKQGDKLT